MLQQKKKSPAQIISKSNHYTFWKNIWAQTKAVIFFKKYNTSVTEKISQNDIISLSSELKCPHCLSFKKVFSCELWPNCGCPSGTKEIFCPGKTIPCSCITPLSHEATQTHPFEAENFCFKTFYCRQTMVSNSCC